MSNKYKCETCKKIFSSLEINIITYRGKDTYYCDEHIAEGV